MTNFIVLLSLRVTNANGKEHHQAFTMTGRFAPQVPNRFYRSTLVPHVAANNGQGVTTSCSAPVKLQRRRRGVGRVCPLGARDATNGQDLTELSMNVFLPFISGP